MDSHVQYQKLDVSKKKGAIYISKKRLVIATAFLLVLLIVSAGAATVLGFGFFHNKPQSRGLSNVIVTDESLDGEYSEPSGGILFHSSMNATRLVVNITSVDGDSVMLIIHSVVSGMTLLCVNGTNFMLMKKEWGYDDYIVPEDVMNVTESLMMEEVDGMPDVITKTFDNKTVNEARHMMMHSLATSEESIYIIEAARSLGEDMGIGGLDHPIAMSFYRLALQLANYNNYTETREGDQTNNNIHKKRYQQVRCENYDTTCPSYSLCPNKGNECLGLCGKTCSCWSFVCGDCCIHNYCLTHDICCGENGFFSWACWSVIWKKIGSQCHETFECTN